MLHEPIISDATLADCEMLGEIAARTFVETFGHMYSAEDLNAHLVETRSAAYFEKALAAGETVLLLHVDGVLAGYGQVGRVSVPAAKPHKHSQEIKRLYIAKNYQGKGYGKAFLLHMLSLPRVATAPAIYLSVWEENSRAKSLYMLHDFKEIGTYLYYVGNHPDREIIMARVR